jgi:thiamine biosynthesis lipoprotein
MMVRAQPWLGTMVEIAIGPGAAPGVPMAASAPALAPAFAAAFASIALVQRLMSFHEAGSDVSRFNRAQAGDDIEVDLHTWKVLQLSGELANASGGCFDVACAPCLVEWSYLPAPAAPAPAFVPGQRIYELGAGARVRKLAAGWIDLGGIAKGYAVDLAIAALQQHGVDSACVNAGGDLRVVGGAPWQVAVRAPHAPASAGARIELHDAALATSANYFSAARRVRDAAVSALVDGRNAQALAGARSVTVRAASCAVADALTKVVMATGDARHPCLSAYGADAFIL